MVHYSLFMILRLNFMLFCVPRDVRACIRFQAFSYELNKLSRFYALTPKITYLGQFSNCMARYPRKVVVQGMNYNSIQGELQTPQSMHLRAH